MKTLKMLIYLALQFSYAFAQTSEALSENEDQLQVAVTLDRAVYFPREVAVISITIRNPTSNPLRVNAPFWRECITLSASNVDGTFSQLGADGCGFGPQIESARSIPPMTTTFAAGEQRNFVLSTDDSSFSSKSSPMYGAVPKDPGSYALIYGYNAKSARFKVVHPVLDVAARVALKDLVYTNPTSRQESRLKQYVHVFSLRYDNYSFLCVGKPQTNRHLVGDVTPGDLEYLPGTYKRIGSNANPIVSITPSADSAGNLQIAWVDRSGKTGTIPYPANGGDITSPIAISYRVTFGSQDAFEGPQRFELNTSSRNQLPWQITGMEVGFSKPIGQANVNSIIGVVANSVKGLKTNTVAWAINPMGSRTVSVRLQDAGPNSIKDGVGNALNDDMSPKRSFSILLGDVNDDGIVDTKDLKTINDAMMNPEDYNIFADLNGDGVVDAKDVAALTALIKPRQ